MKNITEYLTFQDWKEKILELLRNPPFMVALLVSTAVGYWIPLLRPAIGMDDTAAAVDYYINQGGLVMQGRFTTFLVQRLFPIVRFNPQASEVAQLIFLVLAGIAFAAAVLAAGKRPAGLSSVLIAGTLVVYPLQAELFVFTGLSAIGFLMVTIGSLLKGKP